MRFSKRPKAAKSSGVKKTSEPGIGRELPVGLRRYLLLTAALTGAAIMIIEILGAKMLAPYIGTSHFVWTAQIAVTLVALATGYAAGGRLADRSPRLRWMYGAVFLAAGWLGLAVFLTEPLAYGCLRFRLALGSLLAAAGLFFVPLALLATVPPFLVRLMTRALADVGTSVGRLSAISTGGSFLGTVLIGYVLIPLLPNSLTMVGTAGVLLCPCHAPFFNPTPAHPILMKTSTRNKVAGTAKIIKGDAKIALGKVSRNRLLEAKGRAQELLGNLQRDAGKRQKAKGN